MASNNDPIDVVQKFIAKNSDALNQIGFGGVMGYCSGLAFRKASRAVAGIIGVGFIGLQTAKSMGYIDVDWNKIRDDAIKPLDANKDGKLDAEDAKVHWQTYQEAMKDSVPGAGGFSAGFLLGARRG
eukprot:CAMPEP_0178764356 /NCGR_PEP_ID=MMETSP0744-20121128/17752_1 /TAXON_ID=913974 /ORGANISM="Nitzschia punctata, Strain CCMP561" /LENGTH=126 /DNA_ID=CAMNT_0020419535 /DNA_START=14 /DNA_END=394 /DNA_ORIENTATION=+